MNAFKVTRIVSLSEFRTTQMTVFPLCIFPSAITNPVDGIQEENLQLKRTLNTDDNRNLTYVSVGNNVQLSTEVAGKQRRYAPITVILKKVVRVLVFFITSH